MKKKFSWKVFISFGLFFSFFVILFAGIILYLAPAGRVAYWVNWTLFGLNKEEWSALHTIFSFTFAILSILHLFTINWKSFWLYLKKKSKTGVNRKKELIWSTSLTLVILFGTIYSTVPFNYVMDYGEYLTESWEEESKEPPVPHAEKLSIVELAAQLDSISVEQIIDRLKNNDIKFENAEQTLIDIGNLNNIPPLEIYEAIVKESSSQNEGSGIGRLTLEEFANRNNKDISKIIKVLQKNYIIGNKDQTFKEIVAGNNMAAKDLYDLIK